MTISAQFEIRKGALRLDVALRIPGRGLTGLLGVSGSGKTTLLRALAGLDRHPGGYLKVGEEVWQEGAFFLPPHRRAVGYVFQEASLFEHLDVRGNLAYGLRRVPAEERHVALDDIVAWLDLAPLLARRPAHLSGGERQRVAMARALAVSPKVMLMDEPLASVDQRRKQEIYPYLDTLHRQLDIPVLYVSHALDEVARLADHLVLLEHGRVAGFGPVNEMLTRLDLSPAHGRDAEALLEATVGAYDERYQLTTLETEAGSFHMAGQTPPRGERARLRVAARDVSLALSRPSDTSILNIFPATVQEIHGEGEAQVIVRLSLGTVPILSRITRRSADSLDLRPGKDVYAQVKSVALLT